MEEALRNIIDKIIKLQREINSKWEQSNEYIKYNYRAKEVTDINVDEKLLETILNYRHFLAINKVYFSESCYDYKLSSRIKNIDSIYYKIENYIENDNTYGKKPINKCFNDLFGVRIIFNNYFDFNEMIELVNIISKDYDIDIKCIDSSKKEYKAVHVYFKIDNYNFPWELQIWREEDEETNRISHAKYKQGYKDWQNKLKGGDSNA